MESPRARPSTQTIRSTTALISPYLRPTACPSPTRNAYSNHRVRLLELTLESKTSINEPEILEQALVYAVRLLAEMDCHSRGGGALLVPEVFIWTVEQFNPELITTLREAELLAAFERRLEQYHELRLIAEPLRLDAHYEAECEICRELQDLGYLELHDMERALSEGDWHPDDVTARGCFRRVIRAAQKSSDVRKVIDRQLAGFREADNIAYRRHESAANRDADGQADGLDAIVPAAPLASALVHVRRQLLASDDGTPRDLWQQVYTSVLGGWLEDDLPELAAGVLGAGQVVEFYEEAARYLGSMREVERIWNSLSPHVRSLLRCQTTVESAVSIIESVVRADGTPEDEISARTSRIWEMVKRRGLRHRRHRTQHYNKALVSHGTSAVIERIRSDAHTRKTCFVVGRQDVPAPLRSMTNERQCLAIRLPEQRLQVVDDLVSSDGVTCFFSENREAEHVVRLELQVNPAFWCKYDQLWSFLFRFRRTIPVLYVFDTQCILVIYPFSHFSNLKEIANVRHKNRYSVSIREGPWIFGAENYTSKLPDGTQLKPVMVQQVVDISGLPYGSALKEAYITANPGAYRTDSERIA
jgi:hypothetical protein